MSKNQQLAIQQFSDFSEIDAQLSTLWQQYFTQKKIPQELRTIIRESWKRCERKDINPINNQARLVYSNNHDLLQLEEENKFLLNVAIHYMEEIYNHLPDGKLIAVALTDDQGIINKIRANPKSLPQTENYTFFPGTDWTEDSAGTNAIGTALSTGQPTQVFGAEHFCSGWHTWVCSAAPIRDPLLNRTLGILNITGEKGLIQVHDLYYIVSQVKKIEHDITIQLNQENALMLQAITDSIEDPFLVIDINGTVHSSNKPAKMMLDIREGSNLFRSVKWSVNPSKWGKQRLSNVFEEKLQSRDGTSWVTKFFPYKIRGKLFGSIVLFKRDKIIIQKRNKKRKNNVKYTAEYQFADIVSMHPNMISLIETAKKASFSEQTLLITGETGTGKEVLAQSIHNHGSRKEGPFVAVNCSAIPNDLLASELFGYEQGAFTGANRQGKKGKFLLANNGTILLDEIGDMPLSVQTYLLRVLEEQVLDILGGEEPIPLDVRVIASTNKDLEEEVKKGTFREDLYYRLNVINLHLPPLRNRKCDLPLLIDRMINHHGKKTTVDPSVVRMFEIYDWPGNIRELQNVLTRALFYSENNITLKHIPKKIVDLERKSDVVSVVDDDKDHRPKDDREDREKLLWALEKTRWNITQTARILKISRMTVYRKMKRYNL